MQCVACGSGCLHYTVEGNVNSIICSKCQQIYDIYNGVPCLVRYQKNETLSLIEILAEVGKGGQAPSQESHFTWATVLKEYHESEDKDAYRASKTGGIHKWLPHRYRQYAILRKMMENIQLEGKTILNVGSGYGFDTAILESLGASVVSSEFSPRLAAMARPATPESDWLVASGHALPFKEESFDITICQATLHHMLHISQCMAEMLRVLKVGGHMLTISDSYRGNHYGDDFVCKHFNDDVAVLGGINENIPRLNEFSETPDKYKEFLDVNFITSIVYNYPDPKLKVRRNITEPTWWTLDDLEILDTTSGGISWLICKREHLPIPAPVLGEEIIRPKLLLDSDEDRAVAMATLAAELPNEYVNLPFPGDVGNRKFQLLNGWRIRDEGEDGRSAFNRARWFLSRASTQSTVNVCVKSCSDVSDQYLKVFLNGELASKHYLDDTWTHILTDVGKIPVGKTFSIELCLDKPAEKLEDGLFQVRELKLVENN